MRRTNPSGWFQGPLVPHENGFWGVKRGLSTSSEGTKGPSGVETPDFSSLVLGEHHLLRLTFRREDPPLFDEASNGMHFGRLKQRYQIELRR